MGSSVPDICDKSGLIKYECTANPYKHEDGDTCGWHFVVFPKELAKEIRGNHKWQEEGWGRMKAIVQIGSSEWKTSVWFDTKHESYLLPVKAEIRRKEKIEIDKDVDVTIWV